jgi:hypothetical protein
MTAVTYVLPILHHFVSLNYFTLSEFQFLVTVVEPHGPEVSGNQNVT